MILSILKGAPYWVWPLLLFLIYSGFRATRERSTISWPIYLLPLLGALSVNAVNALFAAPYIWVVFVLSYLGGAITGYQYQKNIVLEKNGHEVRLAGEWMTLIILMTVFWMNFIGGVMAAIAPQVYTGTPFQWVFAIIAGLAAGSFLGRAARTFTFQTD